MDVTNPKLLSLVELENSLPDPSQIVRSFRLEGIVRAVLPQQGILVLQDSSSTLLLELPSVDSAVSVGQRLAIVADHCTLTRSRLGIRVSAVPVVNNDGVHSEREASGSVFLDTGMNPIRLDWFNGPDAFALGLDYAAPGISKQKVPNSILWHSRFGTTNQDEMQPGVHYEAYQGNDWSVLPDFSLLNPTAEGIATNFSVSYRTRDEYCGLSFDGFIQISHPGQYTFYLASDDGSRLFVGKPSVSCEVIATPKPSIRAPENFEQALADRNSDHWVEIEGEVTFVSENERSLEIEMLAGGNHVPVTVVEGNKLFSTNVLHHWIRAEGICKFSRDSEDKRLVGVFVPSAGQVEIYDSTGGTRSYSSQDVLTTAAQVRRLKPAEAERHIPARIRGVVIYVSSTAVVLVDSSGGIFISFRKGRWDAQPQVGELWEMQGTTDPGDFSPVVSADKANFLGYAPLPEPIQPTQDQLINGNMDAEYGELHGVITSVSTSEITLLTPDGKVTLMGIPDRPLPELPGTIPSGSSIIGSVVRIRGCFATLVDLQTRQVTPDKVYIYPSQVEVEDPSPPNPFLLSTKRLSDLMWFDARASALQRTKLAGQVIYTIPGEYFVMDGNAGFRVLADHLPSLTPGDLIEVVGFPKLGGPSAVLQEAQIRKTGYAVLPRPTQVSAEKLLDRELDSTLVKVTAVLISDTIHRGEQILELQSGPRYFVARLKSDAQTLRSLPAGCRLELTGVYSSTDEDHGYMGANAAPFELLVNKTADIVVLQRPSWWTIRRAIAVAVGLAGLLCVAFIWIGLLRRKVEQRTVQLKKEIEERQLVEQHHAIERERIRVARDLHDELGAGLTEVSMLGSLANTSAVPGEIRSRYLDQLTRMARSLVTSLDEIVWAVNPHYDSVASLVSYFSLFAESFLNLAGIACRLQVADDIPEYPLDAKQRHGVFSAFKEALNNVIRHSKATEVQIVFEVLNHDLVLSVIDNGCGFEFVAGAPGKDGLTGLHHRLQQLGGDCQIASQPGCGTKIEIRLPLDKTQHAQSRDR